MEWSAGTVKLKNLTIHYYRGGADSRDRPPIVLAHGITDNGMCWNRLASVLSEDYDVIAIDARGHGRGLPKIATQLDDAC